EEDVDVVADGIDFDEWRIVILQNAGNIGVELAAFLIPQKLSAALRAEDEMNDDVGEGLGHADVALTGLGSVVGVVDLGLRSSNSLQPRLSHWGLSALWNPHYAAYSSDWSWFTALRSWSVPPGLPMISSMFCALKGGLERSD